eukprot:m.229855 g.229855  ORF g.229855 m.229855 type:complete len:282 (-) comp54259_c1_seq3:778-1623(-)
MCALRLLRGCARAGLRFASSDTAAEVRTWTVGPVKVLQINRPHRRNAVCAATAELLAAEFRSFEADSSAKVLVLAGAGDTFCAGYDLKETAKGSPLQFPKVGEGNGPMGPSRMRLTKPSIAAVAGHAVAGGLELSLLCDLRVAEENAIFGVFCRRFGVPLIDGGTVRLPAVVGLGRALDLILTGRPVSAQEALGMGLANRVVPKGTALEAAIELGHQLAAFPEQCLRADRASAYFAAYDARSETEALANEFNAGIRVLQSEAIPGALRFAKGEGRGGAFPS